MKTLRYKEIDGYNIVTGICDAETMIDQEATKKIVDKKITEKESSKSIENIKAKMQNCALRILQYKKQAKEAAKLKKDSEVQRLWNEAQKEQDAFNAMQEELKPLTLELKKDYSELMLENAVHFNLKEIPGQGEIYVEDAVAINISELMQTPDSVVDIDSNVIADYRGYIYWNYADSWEKQEINKLGVNPVSGGILEQNLTAEQKAEIAEQLETERVDGLTNAQKATEFAALITAAQKQAGLMKSELEVTGDPDPIGTAQAWLAERVAEIEEKYK